MGKVSEITVTKGKTIKAADREEWIRLEFSIKIVDVDEQEVEAAKTYSLGLLDGWLSTLTSLPSPTPAAQEKLETIQNAFPQELKELLTFEQNNQAIIIRPRGFLGSENFARIAEIVRGAGGSYISAGKDSHFRVPLK